MEGRAERCHVVSMEVGWASDDVEKRLAIFAAAPVVATAHDLADSLSKEYAKVPFQCFYFGVDTGCWGA